MADPDSGFHVVEGGPESGESLPEDTPEVAKAKERHRLLFKAIADRHRGVSQGK